MLEQRIQQHFFDSADLKYQAAENLARPIADAAHAIVGCITGGGKLLVAGQGLSRSVARHFSDLLVGRFERERPGLAAVAVEPLPSAPGASFAAPLLALGSGLDALVLLAADSADPALAEVVDAAHGKEMTVVAIVGRTPGLLREVLSETDVLVAVPHDRAARVHEMHLMIVHCLCDAIDLQLMGEEQAL